jgi:hypothetical protein
MYLRKSLSWRIISKLFHSLLLTLALFAGTGVINAQPGYVKGDFHQHSTYTDGSWSIQWMMSKNNQFGLDWWANSEHGGGWSRDGAVSGTDYGQIKYWDQYNPNPIMGDPGPLSYGHLPMWRWQILRDYAFPQILLARQNLTDKVIIQSYEWNVPGHEHGSVGCIEGQFQANPNVNALAEFEYKFDNSDIDINGGAAQGWTKEPGGNTHARTLAAIQWLQNNFPSESWVVPAHPERQNKYSISDFRDMNNAGPDVCFGFESMPGHQKEQPRGSYSSSAVGSGTFGGCGIFAAQVGGLWDAMLSEGRHWWLFASSDFHDIPGDFYPGEYQKIYTYVTDKSSPYSIIDGLRSGNSYIVEGDLIEDLDFRIYRASGGNYVTMGQTITHGFPVIIKIRIKDPQTNNNYGENPALNHVDLIMGDVNGLLSQGDPLYSVPSVTTTHVIARFDAIGGVTDGNGIKSKAWTIDPDGYINITLEINDLAGNHYFRLRGTNQGLNVANETDVNGNPLPDAQMAPNTPAKAFHDLWFYSNPIFTQRGPANVPLSNIGIIIGGILIALFFILRRRF